MFLCFCDCLLPVLRRLPLPACVRRCIAAVRRCHGLFPACAWGCTSRSRVAAGVRGLASHHSIFLCQCRYYDLIPAYVEAIFKVCIALLLSSFGSECRANNCVAAVVVCTRCRPSGCLRGFLPLSLLPCSPSSPTYSGSLFTTPFSPLFSSPRAADVGGDGERAQGRAAAGHRGSLLFMFELAGVLGTCLC